MSQSHVNITTVLKILKTLKHVKKPIWYD